MIDFEEFLQRFISISAIIVAFVFAIFIIICLYKDVQLTNQKIEYAKAITKSINQGSFDSKHLLLRDIIFESNR